MSETTIDSAQAILAVPEDRPDLLFSGNLRKAEAEYRYLAKQWHPDISARSEASRVFAHVTQLFATAKARLAAGRWESAERIVFRDAAGKPWTVRFRTRSSFELGEILVGDSQLAYRIAPENLDLAGRARRVIDGFAFADGRMRAEIAPSLPRVTADFESGGERVLVFDKAPGMVPLCALSAYFGGRLEPRHVAWILSGMLNLACYLEWAGLAHNAIGPETWLVSPADHRGALAGWFYAVREGEPLTAVPQRSYQAAPSAWRAARRATPALDRELIRLTGRELLGDPAASRLRRDPTIPAAMLDWLDHPAAATAVDDYQRWRRALRASFGPPRFVEMKLSLDDVYNA